MQVFKIPDPDWVIVKATKYNGDPGYWYVIRHQHQGDTDGSIFSCGTQGGVSQQYYCAWCNTPVPDEVQGFRNLCEWSEV